MRVLSWSASRQLTVGSLAIVLACAWPAVLFVVVGLPPSEAVSDSNTDRMLTRAIVSAALASALWFFGGCIMLLGFIRYAHELREGKHQPRRHT